MTDCRSVLYESEKYNTDAKTSSYTTALDYITLEIKSIVHNTLLLIPQCQTIMKSIRPVKPLSIK
jgi:hypothetical protein